MCFKDNGRALPLYKPKSTVFYIFGGPLSIYANHHPIFKKGEGERDRPREESIATDNHGTKGKEKKYT